MIEGGWDGDDGEVEGRSHKASSSVRIRWCDRRFITVDELVPFDRWER